MFTWLLYSSLFYVHSPRASVWKYTQWLKKIKERNYLLPEDSNQSPEDAQDSTAELLDNMIIGSKITNLISS